MEKGTENNERVEPEPEHEHVAGGKLLREIKTRLEALREISLKVDSHWGGEDGFYRFYHGSMKVYWVQKLTDLMVREFSEIGRGAGVEKLNEQFLEVIGEGTGKTFDLSHNQDWGTHTRPILEAFFHAREMLRNMIKYGQALDSAPRCLPSGWAATLYLYNLR